MSDQESDLDQMGAAESATTSWQPGEEAAAWMENLQLREEPAEARWSRGVGRLPDLSKTPYGVTSSRPRKGEAVWLQDQKESLMIAQAMQLLHDVEESRKVREFYAPLSGKGGEHSKVNPEEGACGGEEGGAAEDTSQAADGQARDAAVRGPPALQAPPRRRKKPKIPPLPGKYGGDPKTLGLFLTQVWNHMQDWGEDYLSDAARVRCVANALEGVAAEWMVVLHNSNSPLLRNYNLFMGGLRRRFEDHLAEWKARLRMKGIQQGRRSVAEYTQEFRELAPFMTGWSERALLESFKDGLNEEVYKDCRARGVPEDLQTWYIVAEDVEIDIARSRLRGSRGGGACISLSSQGSPQISQG